MQVEAPGVEERGETVEALPKAISESVQVPRGDIRVVELLASLYEELVREASRRGMSLPRFIEFLLRKWRNLKEGADLLVKALEKLYNAYEIKVGQARWL